MKTYKDTQIGVLRDLLHLINNADNSDDADAILCATCALADFYAGVTVFATKEAQKHED